MNHHSIIVTWIHFAQSFFKTFITTPPEPSTYVLLAKLLIVLPSLLSNTLAIVLLNKINKDKHPSVDVFYWICTVCILGPCSYGLMDLIESLNLTSRFSDSA